MKYSPQLIADCERFIEEGKLNYTVQELLEKINLNVSYNQHITFIPNLPNVKEVYCYNCPLLESLPDWENVEYVTCSNCPLLESLPNWGNVERVSCSSCPLLTSLPKWGNVQTVFCSNCPNLESLPEWEKAEYVDCSSCPLLESLPDWENVEKVYCHNCPLLTSLPKWKNVEYVSCHNCPLLTSLPEWEKVEWVHCYSCPLLESLPKWKNVEYVFCPNCPKLDLTKNDMNENCLVRYWGNGAMIPFSTLLSFLKGEMQALDILRISNVEVRRTLLGFYPTDKLVKELKPVLIEESEMGNRMYLLDLDGIQAKILMYKCPSSDREYTKFIEDHWTCADSAMAFHHGYESVTAYRLDKMQT